MKNSYEYEQTKLPFIVTGITIKKLRDYLDCTQKVFGARIGVSSTTISCLESNRRQWKPTERFYDLFCDWFLRYPRAKREEMIEYLLSTNVAKLVEKKSIPTRGVVHYYYEMEEVGSEVSDKDISIEQIGPIKVYIEETSDCVKIKKIASDIGDINGYGFVLKFEIPCIITVNGSNLTIIVKFKDDDTRIYNINVNDVYYKSYFIDVIELVETFNTEWAEQQKKVNSFNYKKYLFKEV